MPQFSIRRLFSVLHVPAGAFRGASACRPVDSRKTGALGSGPESLSSPAAGIVLPRLDDSHSNRKELIPPGGLHLHLPNNESL